MATYGIGVDADESAAKKALHFSEGKYGLDQIPPEILIEYARVFDYGAEKYARDNWRAGTDWHQFYGSALRHIYKWWLGEDIDPETGLPHLAHALWNVACLRYYQIHGIGNDDRPPAPPEGAMVTDYNKPDKHPAAGPPAFGLKPQCSAHTFGDHGAACQASPGHFTPHLADRRFWLQSYAELDLPKGWAFASEWGIPEEGNS